jgi:SnoaL-like domain
VARSGGVVFAAVALTGQPLDSPPAPAEPGGAATAARFRAAVEANDIAAATELLAPDVVFHSPVTFHPYVGRDAVSRLLGIVAEVFEDFRYTDEVPGETCHGLVFRASVAGRELEGIDMLRCDDTGRIADFTVMVRPLSGLMPFAEAMAERVGAAGLQTTRA